MQLNIFRFIRFTAISLAKLPLISFSSPGTQASVAYVVMFRPSGDDNTYSSTTPVLDTVSRDTTNFSPRIWLAQVG